MECPTVTTVELEQVEGTVYRISYTVYGSKVYCAVILCYSSILATSDKCQDCGESL